MKRKAFVKNGALTLTTLMVAPNIIVKGKNKPIHGILGHGSHQYKITHDWGVKEAIRFPVNDCHEMVQDGKGRLLLLTNEVKNNVIVFDKSGKVKSSWGHDYPGAHGLTLAKENDEEFLFITDYERHEVIKTTLDGKVLMTLPCPLDSKYYTSVDSYKPTEVAVTPKGDFYVADGYGLQHIMHYDHKGNLINVFGGLGGGPENFNNAHGICYDDRDPDHPCLLITARSQNAVKRFTLEGQYIETIHIPGAYVCRPVIDEENVYFAVIISNSDWSSYTGFVTILDKNNKVISNPGGSQPVYEDGRLNQLHQVVNYMKHPHDVCIDDDKNLYIPQWNSEKTYPLKLERV